MARLGPTVAELNSLRTMAEHVNYEMMMLRKADQFLREPVRVGSETSPYLQHAVLNDYLVHLRCLYSFFYARRPREKNRPLAFEDDCLASHFCCAATSQEPAVSKVLNDHYQAMNRRLAHISNLRAGDKSGWRFWELSSAMAEVVTAFFKSLPEDRRRWFEEAERTEFWEQYALLPVLADSSSVTTVSDSGVRVMALPLPDGPEGSAP